MSRIGKLPIALVDGIEAKIGASNEVMLKKGGQSLTIPVRSEIEIQIEGTELKLIRKDEEKQTKAYQGLYRSLIFNGVQGLSKGWSKSLKFNGVGYKAALSGSTLDLNLGFSHPIAFPIPEGIKITVEKQTTVHISGIDRQQVGQIAAQIRSLRPPEPYLGKGVRYVDEVIVKKSGKSGSDQK